MVLEIKFAGTLVFIVGLTLVIVLIALIGQKRKSSQEISSDLLKILDSNPENLEYEIYKYSKINNLGIPKVKESKYPRPMSESEIEVTINSFCYYYHKEKGGKWAVGKIDD